jgi:hypothetical protein
VYEEAPGLCLGPRTQVELIKGRLEGPASYVVNTTSYRDIISAVTDPSLSRTPPAETSTHPLLSST